MRKAPFHASLWDSKSEISNTVLTCQQITEAFKLFGLFLSNTYQNIKVNSSMITTLGIYCNSLQFCQWAAMQHQDWSTTCPDWVFESPCLYWQYRIFPSVIPDSLGSTSPGCVVAYCKLVWSLQYITVLLILNYLGEIKSLVFVFK